MIVSQRRLTFPQQNKSLTLSPKHNCPLTVVKVSFAFPVYDLRVAHKDQMGIMFTQDDIPISTIKSPTMVMPENYNACYL